MPLRSGTRRPAKQLLKRWKSVVVPAGIFPPEEGQVLRLVGANAEGVRTLPNWWANRIAGRPDERWLIGFDPGLSHPFNAHNGRVLDFQITIGISDQRTVLSSRAPWGELWTEELNRPLTWKKPLVGKLVIQANDRSLNAPRTEVATLEQVNLFQGESTERRWALAASRALLDGDPLSAANLWTEAVRLGFEELIWLDLAATAMAYNERALAAAILFHTVNPSTTLPFANWSKRLKPIKTKLQKTDVLWEQISRVLHPIIERFRLPNPPDGLPFPPDNPTETWAYALGCGNHWREAQTLWSSLPNTARSLQGIATCLSTDPATDGNDAWLSAAIAWRKEGNRPKAYTALERLANDTNQPSTRWLRAQWAWEDGQRSIAHQWWTKAVESDEGASRRERGQLSSTALHALAAHAARIDAPKAALHALKELVEIDPGDVIAYWKQAQLAESTEHDIPKAAQLLIEACKHDERLCQTEDPPRWKFWSTLGRYQAVLDQPDSALESLSEAIRGDFLQPLAYQAALNCEQLELPKALRIWWRQLLALLNEGPLEEISINSPAELLDTDRLASLHPGGINWFNQIKTNFEEAPLPNRNQLIRGLEATQADEVELINELANALDMPSPESFWFRGKGAFGCSSWPLDPPVLIIGREHAEPGPRQLSPMQWRFAIGGELAHLKCDHPVLVSEDSLVDSSKSAFRSFGKYAGTASNIVDIITLVPGIDQVAKLQKLIRISRALSKTHSTLDKAADVAAPALQALGLGQETGNPATAGREGWAGANLQNRLHADRIALLLCASPVASITAILKCSSRSLPHVDSLGKQGLLTLLSQELPSDEVIRIGAIFEFCANQRPDLWKDQ
jgi:hypothetical protein